ncbi:MAG: DUF4389 domain-containing protein [Acidimicrobiia bacterium]|nr:DUF4389 domain-containing protein [Acidimicrobiia bacterium]
MAATTAAPYPVVLSVSDSQSVDNWRPLVHWLLVIPHLFAASILTLIAQILAFFCWFIILATGRLPPRIANFQVMLLRFNYRAYGFMWGLSIDYPPFTFDERGGKDDITIDIDPDIDHRNRLTVLVRFVLMIPLVIVALVYSLGMAFIGAVAWFAVLFTGTYPLGLRMMMVGLFQWALRFQAYGWLLVDRYPPFGATVNTL